MINTTVPHLLHRRVLRLATY